MCPTACCTTTPVSEDTGNVDFRVSITVALVPYVADPAGTFEVCTLPVYVAIHPVIVFKLNVLHSVTDKVSLDARNGRASFAFEYSKNAYTKVVDKEVFKEHSHFYDHDGYYAE